MSDNDNMYKLVAFDLDGTLAESKMEISREMVFLLESLQEKFEICIITGGKEEQILTQVVNRLGSLINLEKFHLMPTCGSKYLRFLDGDWTVIYENSIPEKTRSEIIFSMEQVAKDLALWEEEPYGDIIEDRICQITFSALGQKAPIEEKEKWDPSGSKKILLRDRLSLLFPDLEVKTGGTTSIDVTLKGMDKAYGVNQLLHNLGLEKNEIIFVGDRLEKNGNDYPVMSTGVATKGVKSLKETEEFIRNYLLNL